MNPFEKVGQDYYPGSSVEGKVYQDMSALGCDHPAHRGNTAARVEHILSKVDVAGKRVLDIGCANGALSLLLASNGAEVVGVDRDPEALAVARHVAAEKGIGATFRDMDIWSDEFQDLLREGWDVAIWMSQYMWLWKEHGRLRATRTLRMVSDYADNLFFETAQSPNTASAGQDHIVNGAQGVHDLLFENTSYDRFNDIGWVNGWANRNVFWCYHKEGKTTGQRLLIAGPSGAGKTYLGNELARRYDIYHYDFEPALRDRLMMKRYSEDHDGFFAKMRHPLVVTWGVDHPQQARTLFDVDFDGIWLTGPRPYLAMSRGQRGDVTSKGVKALWDRQEAVLNQMPGEWAVIEAYHPDGTRRDVASVIGQRFSHTT